MSGFSTPCSSMFMLPIRSMVLSKSKPWNMRWWKCSLSRRRAGCQGGARASIPRRHEKAGRAAGRVADQITGLGGRKFHHQPDDVARGAELTVLPAVAILPSMYSYRSPLVSRSSMGTSSSRSTTLASSAAVGW